MRESRIARTAISQHLVACPRPHGACTVVGAGSVWEIDENLETMRMILKEDEQSKEQRFRDLRELKVVREEKQISDEEFVLLSGVRKIFQDWMNCGLTSSD
jgi:hypothetical protein